MSATMTPPAAVDAPVQLPQPLATPARIRLGPEAPVSRRTQSRMTERLSYGAFTVTWMSGLAVASVVAAAVLLVAQPILIGLEVHGRRQYR